MHSNSLADSLRLFSTPLVQSKALDGNVFESLLSETSAEVTLEILEAYQNTLAECIRQLSSPDSLKNGEQIYRLCHKMKGSSLLLGFNRLADWCVEAMALSKSANNGALGDVVQLIVTESGHIRERIQTIE